MNLVKVLQQSLLKIGIDKRTTTESLRKDMYVRVFGFDEVEAIEIANEMHLLELHNIICKTDGTLKKNIINNIQKSYLNQIQTP